MVLHGQDKNEQEIFVFETNLPDEIQDFYKQQIVNEYKLRTDVNPFYLRGDFDGDKKLDYAINVIERKTEKKGIVIYHTGTNRHFTIGAGKPFFGQHPGDDFWWMDAWKVEVNIGRKREGILVVKTESSSGLIYWTGKQYSWIQKGD